MAQSIDVLVKDKETGNESTITYKAFLDLQSRFILIGQIANGQLVDGDPNLNPQHQRKPSVKAAVVADVGKEIKPQQSMSDDMQIKNIQSIMPQTEEIKEPEPLKSEEPREKRKYTKRVKETV